MQGTPRARATTFSFHTHPCQKRAEWATRKEEALSDNMHAYSIEEQAALLAEGLDRLVAAGVPRERLLAFRAGNFGASNETWCAMAKVGLRFVVESELHLYRRKMPYCVATARARAVRHRCRGCVGAADVELSPVEWWLSTLHVGATSLPEFY